MGDKRRDVHSAVSRLPALLFSFALGSISLGISLREALLLHGVGDGTPERVSYVCAALSAFFWLSYLPKIFLSPRHVWSDLLTPATHSAISAGSMALANHTVIVYDFSQNVSKYLWLGTASLHLSLTMAYILMRIMRKESFQEVFYPYCFASMVGVASVAAVGEAQMPNPVAQVSLYLGLAWMLLLFPIVVIRLLKFKLEEMPKTPAIVIIVAPVNLVLAAKLAIQPNEYRDVNYVLFFWGIFVFLYSIPKMVTVLRLPFVASHASLTFPSNVITIATFRFFRWSDHQGVYYWGMILLSLSTILNILILSRGIFALLSGRFTQKDANSEEQKYTSTASTKNPSLAEEKIPPVQESPSTRESPTQVHEFSLESEEAIDFDHFP